MWWQAANGQWYNIQGPSAHITEKGKESLMGNDFTSAEGTRNYRSGRGWSLTERKVTVKITHDTVTNQHLLSNYLYNKTGYAHTDLLHLGEYITHVKNVDLVSLNRILAKLGIMAKGLEITDEG